MATSTYHPDTTGCTGWQGNADATPNSTLAVSGESEYTSGEKTDTSSDNGTTVSQGGARACHRIRFTIAEAEGDVTQLDFKFNADSSGPGGVDYDLFVYDDNGSTWGTSRATNTSAFSDYDFTASITTSVGNYIDGSGNVFALLMIDGGSGKTSLLLDLAELVVTYTESGGNNRNLLLLGIG